MLSPCEAKRGTIPQTMGDLQVARNRSFEVARVVEIADDKEWEIRELKVKIAALEANASKSRRGAGMIGGSNGEVRWRGVWWSGVWWGGVGRGCYGGGVGVGVRVRWGAGLETWNLGAWGLGVALEKVLGRSWGEGGLGENAWEALGRDLGRGLGQALGCP